MTITHKEYKAKLKELEALHASIPTFMEVDCSSFNAEHLQAAIDVLERVERERRAFDIGMWFDNIRIIHPLQTEEEQHACGSSACALGWIATTEAWRKSGGVCQSNYGTAPTIPDANGMLVRGANAGASWLNIPLHAANMLFFTTGTSETHYFKQLLLTGEVMPRHTDAYYGLYDVDKTVHARDVVKALIEIRDTGKLVSKNHSSAGQLETAIEVMKRNIGQMDSWAEDGQAVSS